MIIIFDTETTGLTKPLSSLLPDQPKIIEFAGIKLNEKLEEIDRLEFLVDPEMSLPSIITKVTGLETKDVINQGTFITHLEKLQNFFLGTKEMVAHNVMFDHDMLYYELKRIGKITQFPWPIIRTCTVEKTYHINNHRLKLSALYNHLFGEEFEGAHRAMVDVEALTRCYIELKKRGIL